VLFSHWLPRFTPFLDTKPSIHLLTGSKMLSLSRSRILPSISRPLHRAKAAYATSSSSTPTNVTANIAAEPKETIPVVAQAPNYPTTWSASQQPRPTKHSGPRFEQAVMEVQPNPLSAMELIANEPIRLVQGRKAVCDGGGGPLGHPKIFINLDKPGPRACGYCGIRFEQYHHHH
jgi:NADH dehydrogenase (ubiquinone) Fe-S protein 6